LKTIWSKITTPTPSLTKEGGTFRRDHDHQNPAA
jgi:hypothetical protein